MRGLKRAPLGSRPVAPERHGQHVGAPARHDQDAFAPASRDQSVVAPARHGRDELKRAAIVSLSLR